MNAEPASTSQFLPRTKGGRHACSETLAGRPKRAPWRAPFWLEMTILVSLKLVLLGVIWHLWFSRPIAVHMHMSPNDVGQHLLGTPVSVSSALPPSGQPS